MAVNFNAILEEIKATNWQDAGTWHAAPKALVLIVVGSNALIERRYAEVFR